ncbi:hypothetical protein MINTM005_13290 [Mycobacterium intracellulare]|uniref:phage tail termination protein n=1 Tax=Mycobacterium intracellulare TaxID=1767 RepID=UPI0019294ACF|nr:hypothetical protein [Mycobacterium intracellulare]BCO56085.1 hypothetical protein MINTM005_13290 [Mycobacterium intracellulare]
MTLVLPDWYQGGYEDVEAVLCDMFSFLLGSSQDPETGEWTGVPVVTWLEDDYYDNPRPVLRVHRASGKAFVDLPFDHAVVQIGAFSQSRKDSWELITFVRTVMAAASGGFKVPRLDGTHTQINSVDEWAGPVQSPDDFIDDRFVPASYKVVVRGSRRYNPDYYRRIMDNL